MKICNLGLLFTGIVIQGLLLLGSGFHVAVGFPYYSSLSPNGYHLSLQPGIDQLFLSPAGTQLEVTYVSNDPADISTHINDFFEQSLTSRLFTYFEQNLNNHWNFIPGLRGTTNRGCLHDCREDITELCTKKNIDENDHGAVVQCLMAQIAFVNPNCKAVLDNLEIWEDNGDHYTHGMNESPIQETNERSDNDLLPEILERAISYKQFMTESFEVSMQASPDNDAKLEDMSTQEIVGAPDNQASQELSSLPSLEDQSASKDTDSVIDQNVLMNGHFWNIRVQDVFWDNEYMLFAVAGAALILISAQLILYARPRKEPKCSELGYVSLTP